MSIKAVAFSILGLLVGAFYGLESFLSYQATGLSGPTLVKVAICGLGVYVFLRNAARIRRTDAASKPAGAD